MKIFIRCTEGLVALLEYYADTPELKRILSHCKEGINEDFAIGDFPCFQAWLRISQRPVLSPVKQSECSFEEFLSPVLKYCLPVYHALYYG